MPRNSRLIIASFAVLALCEVAWRARSPCVLEQGWTGPVPHDDYLRTITFERGGRGEMVYGYAQTVRCEVTFRWERDGDRLTLDGREIGVHIERGRFTVPVNDYPEPTPRDFACHVAFDVDPFPGGCGVGRDFFACPLDR